MAEEGFAESAAALREQAVKSELFDDVRDKAGNTEQIEAGDQVATNGLEPLLGPSSL